MKSSLFPFLILLSVVTPHATEAKADAMISRDKLVEMFANIRATTNWKIDGVMLWGYFFTHSSREPLVEASHALQKLGYRVVDIYQSDDDTWWLHIEKEEKHTVSSLHAANRRFYRFAASHGLKSYDGMDVGPVPEK
jgi:hypothetical protein